MNYRSLIIISLLFILLVSCQDNSMGRVDREHARIDTVNLFLSVTEEHVYDGELVDLFLISQNKYRKYIGSYMPGNKGEIIKVTTDGTLIFVKKYKVGYFSNKSSLCDSVRYRIDNLNKVRD